MAGRGQFWGWCALIFFQLTVCSAQTTVTCNEEYTSKSQQLQSTDPYSDDENCQFYINYASGLRTSINFEKFALEYKADYLYIGLGGAADVNIDNALYTFTGDTADHKIPEGPITIESGRVWFLFQTDFDTTDEGFKFTYTSLDYCEATEKYYGPSGEITTPTYPAAYWSNLACESQIEVSVDAQILLQFHDVDIDEDDVLTILDGSETWTVSGSHLPKDYLSSSYELELTFESGSSNNTGRGFRLSYKEVRIVVPQPKGPTVDYTFDKMTGFKLATRNYPNPNGYEDNSLFQFRVTVPTGMTAIYILDLNLEEGYDMMMIGAGSTFLENSLYNFTANPTEEPASIHIHDETVWVWFKSDYNETSRGFNLLFEPHAMHAHKSPPPDFGTDPIELCGTDLVIKSPVNISHPEYPDHYNNNTLCNWRITNKDQGERLRLRFLDFDTESMFDILEIGLGPDPTTWNSRYQWFSGQTFSPVMVVPSDSIWVKFTSDYSNVAPGFNIQVEQALDPNCYAVYVLDEITTNVSFTSPGYGESNYTNNLYCQWIIKAPAGSIFAVNFHDSLDTEDNYDLLEMGSGDKPGYLDMRRKVYSGNWAEDFLAQTDTMWVTFTSDESVTGEGFSLTISIEPNCGVMTLHEESGVITSPWYPEMYPNDADCFWIVQVDGRFTVRLTFDQFDLEEGHDKLYIGGVDAPSDGVSDFLVMTGDSSQTIQSNYNGINLRFKSDGSTRGKGFQISYEQVYECAEGWEFGPDGDCYKFVTEAKSWLDARYECDNIGEGDLAIIDDQAELDYIMERMANISGNDGTFWVGAYDAAVEGEFEWGDCTTSTLFFRNNFNGLDRVDEEKDCAFYDPVNNYFDHSECATLLPFVCEVTALDNLDIYPRALEGTAQSTTEVLLEWDVSPVNCDIDAYRVRYNISATEYMYAIAPGAESDSLEIIGLQPDTTYNFEMTIVTYTYGNYSFRTAKSVIVQTNPLPTCPDGYVLGFDDGCYKFSIAPMTWRDARLDCATEQDSDLVNIETAEENEVLRGILGNSNNYWINLFDEVNPNSFQWATLCIPPPYQNWEEGSPSTGPAGASKGCAEMDGNSGEWRDNDCSAMRMYVCEIRDRVSDIRDLSPSDIAAQPRTHDTAFAAWDIGPRTCDVIGYNIIATFNDSSSGYGMVIEPIQGGESANGEIDGLPRETDVTITVGAESYTFGALTPLEGESAEITTYPLPLCPPFYTRGYDEGCYRIVEGTLSWFDARAVCKQVEHGDLAVIEAQEELDFIAGAAGQGTWWIGMTDLATEDDFQWVTCESVTGWAALNWGAGQPSDVDMTQNCVRLNDGKWDDSSCDALNNFVCEINEKDFDPTDANPFNIMAEPASLTSLTVSWAVSDNNCDLTGYQIWVDGPELESPRVDDVAGAQTTSYELKDLLPDSLYRLRMAAVSGGIVQSFTLPEVIARTANESSGLCPQDYQRLFRDTCYYLGLEAKTWESARAECQRAPGGDLMVINDDDEYNFIVGAAGNIEWWMGLYDEADEGIWRWVDCSDKDDNYWFGSEPDDFGKQDCGFLLEGLYYDWQCEDSFPFVCEVMDKGFEPEDANPTRVSYTPLAYDTVQASWTTSDYNCEVTGYKIRYSPVPSTGPPEVVEVMGGNRDRGEVTGLWPETRYQFDIAAMTLTGDLNYTQPGTAVTLVFGAPGCVEPLNVTAEYGEFTSPYYPEQYPPNLDCTWIFHYPEGKRLQLDFLSWVVADPDDQLIIQELSPEHASRPATKLTGAATPDQFKSYGNQVSVSFVTDSATSSLGFQIAYSAIDEELPEDKGCTSDLTIKANSLLTIESEGYPVGYSEFLDCTWIVRSSGTGGVTLRFLDIDFDNSGGDYLEVGTGDEVSTGSVVRRFTDLSEEFLNLASGVIWINFRTDGGDSGTGFSIRAQDLIVVPPKGLVADADLDEEEVFVASTCDETVVVPVETRQEISSPGFGVGGYNNSEDCLWILDARNGKRFRLSFNAFDLEYGYDFVEVGYGENPEDRNTLLLRATGDGIPGSMMIPDDAGWVHFSSDESTTAGGFSFYVQEDTGCYHEFDLPYGGSYTLQTPNYPNNYGADEYCWWEINGEHTQNLRILVEDFETEQGFDFVEIGVGGAPLLTSRFLSTSGSLPAESISVGYFRTWVTFTSDSGSNRKGIKMTVYDDSCLDQSLTGPTGWIASPGFGDAYYNNLDCRWSIAVSPGYSIRLTFTEFDLEYGRDHLYVTGVAGSPLEDVPLTGSDIPDDILSASNVLQLNLETDFSTTAGGFNLTYEEVYYCDDGFEAGEGHDGTACYYLGTTPKSWTDARDHCRSFEDSDLVIIENALENRHVRGLSAGDDLWIGYYDAQVENTFNWADCVTSPNGFAIYNWNSTQPDNANRNEDCAAMLGMKEAGYYADFPCEREIKYVCEKRPGQVFIDPSGSNPTEISAKAMSQTIIRVRWTPTGLSDNCDHVGYAIHYTDEQDNTMTVTVNGRTTQQADLFNLTINSYYTIKVVADTFSTGMGTREDSITLRTLSPIESYCPNGYTVGPDYTCFYFSEPSDTRDWQDARRACEQTPTGELAVLDTPEELEFVEGQTSQSPYWIGLNDLAVEGDFRWSDCQPITVWQQVNFATGEPDDTDGTQNCVAINPAGSFIDTQCSGQWQYICELVEKDYVFEDQYPISFTVEAVSALSLRATWVASQYTCDLLGYKITYNDGLGDTGEVVVDDPLSGTVLIEGLTPDTNYAIGVIPYNTLGDLPMYAETNAYTLPESTLCPDEYIVGFNYGCYQFNMGHQTWADARTFCQQAPKGDLAIMDDPNEMAFLLDNQLLEGYDWWIGLSDHQMEGTFRWTDCNMTNNFTETRWAPGQPSDVDGSDNCVQLSDDGMLNDRDCGSFFPFVCETNEGNFAPEESVPTLFQGTASSHTTVDLSWEVSSKSCELSGYRVYHRLVGSGPWSTVWVPGAMSNSLTIRGLQMETTYQFQLRSVDLEGEELTQYLDTTATTNGAPPCPALYQRGPDQECYRFVQTAVSWAQARESCQQVENGELVVIDSQEKLDWISEQTLTGDWWMGAYDQSTEGRWRWVDCTDFNDFSTGNWAAGQPSGNSGEDCAVLLQGGNFNDWTCESEVKYICQTVFKSFVPEDASPSDIAATVASFTSIDVTWSPSPYNCDVTGYKIWASEAEKGSEPMEYTVSGGDVSMFEVLDLLPETTYEFTVAAVTLSGALPYVMPVVTETLPDENADLCPQGYCKLYNNACYKIGSEMLTWFDARLDCQSTPGSDLIIINDASEDAYFRNVGLGADWWIGLYDVGVEGDFQWIDCSAPAPFSNWGPGEPDNFGGDEDCVLITPDWYWGDWDCTTRVMYLCEISDNVDVDPADANPSDLLLSANSYSEVQVTWSLGAKVCDNLGYNIRYREVGALQYIETFVEGGDTTEYILGGLRPLGSYEVSVSARTWTDGNLAYLQSETVTLPNYDAPGCDGTAATVEHGAGNLSSPLSPDFYPPNVECTYVFNFDEGSRIEFQYFLWVLTDTNDYIEITELNPQFADVPPKILTGLATPKIYLSYGNRIQVRFVSDASTETPGYIILYRPVEMGFPTPKCSSDLTLKENAEPLLIQSEGYPNGYGPYQDCTWILRAGSASNAVAIDIYDISLETNSDWVDIGLGADPTDASSRLYRYDGSEILRPDVVYVEENVAWVRFRSDDSQSGDGISFGALEWSGKTYPPKDAATKSEAVVNAICDLTLIVPLGGGATVIHTPNYPNDYGNNEACIWNIVGNEGRRFKISFDSFDTEEGYDFIEVTTHVNPIEGVGPAQSLLRTSGDSVPGDIVFDNQYGTIRFTSDQTVTASGFQLRVFEDVGCEGVVTVPADGSVSFSTPGYPDSPYVNNEYCFWTVRGQPGVNLRGEINGISIEPGYDYIDMGWGNSTTDIDSRIARSSELPEESFSFGADTAWVIFASDGSVTDDGLQMTFYDDSCLSDSFSGEMGTILSPGFGSEYFNFLNCRWTITVVEPYHVGITFQSFDLETDRDFLLITGTLDAPLIALPLTGNTLPGKIVSALNVLVLDFETDGGGTRAGFELTWMKDYNCPEGYTEGTGSYGPECYKFGATPRTWQAARQDCRTTPNADLVIIENAIENRYIKDMSGGDDQWIGIYDVTYERTFFHTDCVSNLLYYGRYNWNATQPDGIAGGDQDCVAMLGDKEAGYYADFQCARLKKYVCEVQDAGVIYDPALSKPMNVNGEGTSTSSIRVYWNVADLADCDLIGYTAFYDGPIGPRMSTSVDGSDATYIDIEGLQPSTTYTISIWANTFSFGQINNEEEIMVSTLSISDVYCPEGYVEGPDYGCYRISEDTLTWQGARDACRADDPDSDLTVIETQEEVDYLISETGGTEDYWIGLNDLSVEAQHRWTDCSFLTLATNQWQARNWAEGEPSGQDCGTLTPTGQWADELCSQRRKYICEIVPKPYFVEDQYPSNFDFTIRSALTAQATWVPSPRFTCDILGYRVFVSDGLNPEIIAEREGGISLGVPILGLNPDTNYAVSWAPYNAYGDLPRVWEPLNFDTPPVESLCDDGYIVGYDYSCYKFVSNGSLSWSDARKECQKKQRSDLAIIDNADELEFIVDAGLVDGFDWWIGLSDRASEGWYYWTDCSGPSNFTMNNWDLQQPSDSDGSENCIVLQDNAKLNDRDCSRTFPYVCEISSTNFDERRSYPLGFSASAVSESSIKVSWVPSPLNCDITGYRVTYFQDPAAKMHMDVEGGNTDGATVTGLIADTAYTFYLAVVTPDGTTDDIAQTEESTLPPMNPCPDGWVVGYMDRCYRFGTQAKDYWGAREDCRSIQDGDLVVIETAIENAFIYNLTQGGMWWIGYNDIAIEEAFSWVDCDAVTDFAESNWEPGQPDDMLNNQDCAIMTNSGQYNDWDCSEPIRYLCEQSPKGYNPEDANPRSISASATNPATVEVSWVPESRYNCDVLGYRVIYSNPTPIIIDVPGADSTSLTITGLEAGTTYSISVGAYTYFEDLPYIDDTSVTTPSEEGWCEEGWVPGYEYKCYKFGTNTLSWEAARLDCQSVQSGDLAVFETEAEWDFVSELGSGTSWWLGLFDRATEGDYRWVTCDPLEGWAADNWASGQPNDLQGSQDCVQMLGSGLWNDLECTAESAYVCEVTMKEFTESDQSPRFLQGDALDPNTVRLTWTPSEYSCEVLGYIIYTQLGIDTQTQMVEGGETSMALVKDLEPSETYVFDIAAYTTYATLSPTGTTARVTMPSTSSGECGPDAFTGSSGVILSPNYPDEYSNNQQCSYFITLPEEGTVVRLSFNEFSLENGHDFLTIGIGSVPFENTEHSLTGSEVPDMITTSSSMVWMFFSSDESFSAAGFSISFESLEVETTGETVGSVTVKITDESADSFMEMEESFKSNIASELNAFCAENSENCLTEPGVTFTAEDIVITGAEEVEGGVEVTFWVRDPTDETGSSAALTSGQLEEGLSAKEENIESGGGFDLVIIGETSSSAWDEPWVIGVTCAVGFCVLVLLLVLMKNCFCPSTKSSGSSTSGGSNSDVEMVAAKSGQEMWTTEGGHENQGVDVKDEVTRVAHPDDPSAIYTVPEPKKATTKAQIESSEDGGSSALEDDNEPGSSSSSVKEAEGSK